MELPKDKKVIRTRHNKVVYDCGDTVAKVFNATKPPSLKTSAGGFVALKTLATVSPQS